MTSRTGTSGARRAVGGRPDDPERGRSAPSPPARPLAAPLLDGRAREAALQGWASGSSGSGSGSGPGSFGTGGLPTGGWNIDRSKVDGTGGGGDGIRPTGIWWKPRSFEKSSAGGRSGAGRSSATLANAGLVAGREGGLGLGAEPFVLLAEEVLEDRVPGAPEQDLAFGIQVRRGHPVVDAVTAAGEHEVEPGQGVERLDDRPGDLADLGAQPSQDPADLLRLAGPEVGELRRLLGDGLRLDVDRLVAGAGPVDGPLQLAAELAGDRQDVVLADDREVRVAEVPADLRRAEHRAEEVLDAFLDRGDLAADLREPPARGVEDPSPRVEAAVDGVDDAGELADLLADRAEPGELLADPAEPAVGLADHPEAAGDLGQLLGRQGRPDRRAADGPADVEQAAERRREPAPRASAISVVSAWRWRTSPGSVLGSIASAASRPSGLAAYEATRARTRSNSRSSSVCVSIIPQGDTAPGGPVRALRSGSRPRVGAAGRAGPPSTTGEAIPGPPLSHEARRRRQATRRAGARRMRPMDGRRSLRRRRPCRRRRAGRSRRRR